MPTKQDLKDIQELGIAEVFKRTAREIAVMDMFDEFRHKGWTPKLARQVRQKLGPKIIQTVTLAWYAAAVDADLIEGQK